tara:strand:+ start:103 stop:567 length:465 start_codon:yes stop_codon:yes gene_type:complete
MKLTMRKTAYLLLAVVSASLLFGCGGGSTSGGVGTSTSGFYRGTISWSGYNTCGRQIPGSGKVEITIRSDGTLVFDPVGLKWGRNYGYVTLRGAVSGSRISGTWGNLSDNDYIYGMDGRINDGGATVSGTGSLEGNYGSCYEKYQGSFAATRVG